MRVKLGRWPAMDTAEARQRARELAQEVEAGIYGKEPAGVTRPLTLTEMVELFISAWCKPRNRRWQGQQRTLERVIGSAADLRRHGVLDQVGPVDAVANGVQVVTTICSLDRSPAERGGCVARDDEL